MTDVGIDNSTPEIPTPIPAPDAAGNARDAARTLSEWRHQKPKEPTAKAAEPAPAVEESTPEGDDAGAVEQPPSETPETDPAELPSIEPPRSWTKEDKELFAGLPRETQERLAERERSRDTDFSRRQNEAVEKLKGLTAKEQAVEQARQQYEQALPVLLQTMQAQQAGDFADIQTVADVERMSIEDPMRYTRWDFQQKKIAAVAQQMQIVQQQRMAEHQRNYADFAKEQDRLFVEKVPDMADDKKAGELQKAAVSSLELAGFNKDELAAAWRGNINVPFRDHRVMLMIHKASLWDQAQAKAKTITTNAKPVPPVQRPGAAQPKGAAQQAQVTSLTNELKNSRGMNSLRTAAKLLKAARNAR